MEFGGGSSSSYLRIEAGRAKPSGESVDHPSSLIFIDVSGQRAGGWEGEVADQLRFVDETAIADRAAVVIRAPDTADPDGINLISASLSKRTRQDLPIGQVTYPIGAIKGPELQWFGSSTSATDSEVLASARAIELAALIASGKAHWRPSTFHYRLPSGQHRSDFIRLADAFRSPRDARVIADWLLSYVDTGRALIMDTSTLLPVALALEDAASRVKKPLGPVVVRDAYPDSLLSDEELIELTVGANGALVLLSVSSSGRTLESLENSLERKGIKEWWIETLVDRTRPAATRLPDLIDATIPSGITEPWLHIPDLDPYDEYGCSLCRHPVMAPCVRIDPASFSNTALSEPSTISMPDPPVGAREIANLLELYRDVDGIGVDCDPAERTKYRRIDRRWAVRFYPHLLLTHPRFLDAAEKQLTAESVGPNDGKADLDKIAGFDAIAYLDADKTEDGSFESFLEWLTKRLGGSPVRYVEIPSRPEDLEKVDLTKELADSSHILVVTVGTVTGGTLHELRSRINRAKAGAPKDSFHVSGLVIHARPPTFKEWRSARSAYADRLVALWITYLPSNDHPLADEQRLFRQTLDVSNLTQVSQDYVMGRRSWILNNPQSDWLARRATWQPNNGDINPSAVLLCGEPERSDEDLPSLQPNSLFGHRMGMVGTLVGVGAALHRARLDKEAVGGPPGIRFDMSRIPSVYFEVPIICAVLRWIRPYEAFWEYEGRPAEDVLREIWHQAGFEESGSRSMLLAELCLAAAASKLPRHTYPMLVQFREELASSDAITPAIEVSWQLLIAAWGPEPTTDDADQ
jgi:hypothetical protein